MVTASPFKIVETLGRGGFGTVYRAELVGEGGFTKQVAVKVLNQDREPSPEAAGRFRDEARILGLLQHRAIVRVDTLTQIEQGWALVMEYIPGVDLKTVIGEGKLPPRVALSIIEEIASALHAAYATPSHVTGQPLRLLHRDIKPSNVRLTEGGEVKVLDFGVARANFIGREAHTRSVIMGSLRYMAPERLENIESPAGDIYSLGLVLAEMLTGVCREAPPKHARRHAEFMEGVRVDVVNLLDGMAPGYRDEVVRLLARMTEYEPDPRPTARQVEQTVRHLAEKIEGDSLRTWAEAVLPALVGKQRERAESRSSGFALDGGLPEIPPAEGKDDVTLDPSIQVTPEGWLELPPVKSLTTTIPTPTPKLDSDAPRLLTWVLGGAGLMGVSMLALAAVFPLATEPIMPAAPEVDAPTQKDAPAQVDPSAQVDPATQVDPPAQMDPAAQRDATAPHAPAVGPSPAPSSPPAVEAHRPETRGRKAPPVAPAPAPVAPVSPVGPAPAPQPAAPTAEVGPAKGKIRFDRDVPDRITLKGAGGGTYAPGDPVPAGVWPITFWFGGDPIDVSKVEVRPDASETIVCDRDLLMCTWVRK